MSSTKGMKCGGCLSVIAGVEYVTCHNCHHGYDLLCANINKHEFKQMNSERKRLWVCDGCRNKQPKSNKNETPVRQGQLRREGSQQAVDTEDPHLNVTLRRKPSQETQTVSFIRDEVCAALREELTRLLPTMLAAELAPVKKQLNDLQTSVKFVSDQYDDLSKSYDKLLNDHKALIEKCNHMSMNSSSLIQRVNSLEQYLRESNLEIQGVPESKSENIFGIVKKIANAVGYALSDSSILNCTRVASMNRDGKRPRTIIAKMYSTRCRDEFYSAVARFNRFHMNNKLSSSLIGIAGESRPIFVSEHLSPDNKVLHAATRQKAKENKYKFVWVRNGRIFLRKDETSRFVYIKNREVLDSFNW
ncbi:unnamed protein product [Diatraea saccharalis]|uniref:FP protein C-terminal domain-containing protein n=1 Tax=Diatraea saccharalis TaxID=40085 RepID=A0A9N9WHD7_9NEOP|nr:unnamed protein product [Diatraea saccharalis]